MSYMSSPLRLSDSYLNGCLSHIVSKINASQLTIYSYTGNKEHKPIYYEEIGLFQKLLKSAKITCSVIEVSDAEFSPEEWNPKRSILHIPGAKSSDLDQHIGSKVEAIKTFINKGGRFIGWCGGGYWACHEVQYRMSDELTFNKVRDLNLWKGMEKGPFLPFPGCYTGSIEFFHGAVKIKWPGSDELQKFFPDGVQLNVLLSGGGSFVPAQEEHTYKVLASYEEASTDQSLAGVKTYVGEGIAILINPYFTYGADYLKSGLENYQLLFPQHNWSKIYSELEGQELKSMLCFADMLLEALIT